MRRLLALHDLGSDIGDYDRSAFRILGRAGNLRHTTFVLRQNLNLYPVLPSCPPVDHRLRGSGWSLGD